jgi:hypothetical protein
MAFTDPPYNVNYANAEKDKRKGKKPSDSLRCAWRRLWCAAVRCLRQRPDRHEGRHLHLHVIIGARPAAEGVPRRWREVAHLRDLGQEHFVAQITSANTSPSFMEGRHRSLLVRRARPRRRLVLRQATQERLAPYDEAGGLGRAGDPQFFQEP